MTTMPTELLHLLDYSYRTSPDLDMSLNTFDRIDEIPLGGPNKIFISSLDTSVDMDIMETNEIKTILYISDRQKPVQFLDEYEKRNIAHHFYDFADHPDAKVETVFDETFDVIEKSIQKGNVLIHCHCGISRSVTILLYYMMKKKVFHSVIECLKYIREFRPIADPNEGFLRKVFWATRL